jgi:hypothetical protein
MRTALKIGIVAGAGLLLSGGGATLYFLRREAPTRYWTPSIQQETSVSVVGEGTTILATPVKAPRDRLDFELIGQPLKVTITPRITSEGVLAVTFSGITDYQILFPSDFTNQLLKVLDEFEAVGKRVREQKRHGYQQRLASIPFRDIAGARREIAVLLKSTPERLIKKNGLETEDGQVIYLRLELPFRLEDTTNFKHTEVSIPESGVRHFRELLRTLERSIRRDIRQRNEALQGTAAPLSVLARSQSGSRGALSLSLGPLRIGVMR